MQQTQIKKIISPARDVYKSLGSGYTNELALMSQTSARDILNDLGPILKEEVDYYENL